MQIYPSEIRGIRIIKRYLSTILLDCFIDNILFNPNSFFNKMHTNHYKVYNLCSERTYEKTRFPDVSYYPFEDH